MSRNYVIFLVALITPLVSVAADLTDASNYRQYSETLASSGQPSAAQLEDAAEQGFQRIFYLAFSDNDTAIKNEDRVVKKLGMDYIHIPVDFDRPTLADFRVFASAMHGEAESKTLVHCQVNFRASTFTFLYRVTAKGVSMLDAKENLDDVWAPNEVWFRFIRTVLEAYGLSPACEGCDWGANEFLTD